MSGKGKPQPHISMGTMPLANGNIVIIKHTIVYFAIKQAQIL